MSPDALVKVARAQNQAEAEFLEGILDAENIPVLVRRAPGADVPDFLAAGARDILVPASMADSARDALFPGRRDPAATPPPVQTDRRYPADRDR
jgi:hypothetical protein